MLETSIGILVFVSSLAASTIPLIRTNLLHNEPESIAAISVMLFHYAGDSAIHIFCILPSTRDRKEGMASNWYKCALEAVAGRPTWCFKYLITGFIKLLWKGDYPLNIT
jgi:hypothetical protein